MTLLLFAAVLAYALTGLVILNRAMAHVMANAANDAQFFQMAFTNSRSFAMILPKLLFVALWLPSVIAIVAFLLLRRFREGLGGMSAATA